jgi:hypothetical protein
MSFTASAIKSGGGRNGALRGLARSLIAPCLAALALAVPILGCGSDPKEVIFGGEWPAQVFKTRLLVQGGDVYAWGVQHDPSTGTPGRLRLAALWRNGRLHRRIPETGYAQIDQVAVSLDGRVHAMGFFPTSYSHGQPYWGQTEHGVWKDGVFSPCPQTIGGRPFNVLGVAFVGDDEYVLGRIRLGDLGDAGSWRSALAKNGEAQALSDQGGSGLPVQVFLSGGDVYVAGYMQSPDDSTRYFPVFWKNGERCDPTGGMEIWWVGAGTDAIRPVHVHGGDVYLAGDLRTPGASGDQAFYVKNDRIVFLPAAGHLPRCNSVFVSGGDVYAVGYESLMPNSLYYCRAVLWKNGERVVLGGGYQTAEAEDVLAHGADVYVVGTSGPVPVLWKNGVMQWPPFAPAPK